MQNTPIDSIEYLMMFLADSFDDFFISSCPYFRNEIGGEDETGISLTRETGKFWGLSDEGLEKQRQPAHTPR